VHSTPGARPCTRHLVRARALDTWCAPVHSTPPLPTGAVVIPAQSHDSVTHCTLDIQAFLKKTISWCVAGWCAPVPVHSTPGARPCTRHLVRARALDTWCAPVHSTPGARPCTRHFPCPLALWSSQLDHMIQSHTVHWIFKLFLKKL